MLKKMLLLVAALFATSAFATENIDWNQVIPNDTCVIKGVLPNGLTYYIRHNEEPKGRCNFYLVRNVGAVCENDDQNGLAHFLEHMAFNGSKNFKPGQLVDALKRHGVSYGNDLNASTGLNQTVYHIANAKTSDAELIDTCLLVLHDWTCYMSLTDTEINKERGVIMGEWRSGDNADFRINHKITAVEYEGSIYAKRDVIGDTTIIKTFDPQKLRDFYRDWYRTDLEAVVIVGDIDAKAMEKRVIDMFSSVPAVENAPAMPVCNIPSHQETRFVLATDPEGTQNGIRIERVFQEPKWENNGTCTMEHLRETLLVSFFNNIFSQRIYERLQNNDAPYINASISLGDDEKHYYCYNMSVVAKTGEEEAAVKGVLEENQRLIEHGVTQSEVDRLITNYKEDYSSSMRDYKKQCTNNYYTGNLMNDFLDKSGYPDYPSTYEAVMKILPTITADDVWNLGKKYWTADNRNIIVTGSSADTVKHITEERIRELVLDADNMQTTAYSENVSDEPLITESLKGAKLVKTEQLPQFKAECWTLSNGAKVIYRFADFEKDQVSVYAQSFGGGSKITDLSLIPAYQSFENFANAYGLGNFSDVELTKKLAGKMLSTQVALGSLTESVSCQTTPQDFETVMQLLYLTFVHPRFDAVAHTSIAQRCTAALLPKLNQPEVLKNNKWQTILYDNNARINAGLWTADYYDKITLESIKKIYQDRFRDAGDFTFFIVGNVSKEDALAMAKKYIGSIPGGKRREKWDNIEPRYIDHDVTQSIVVPSENPAAESDMVYYCEMPYSVADDYRMDVMSTILQVRCEQIIREEKGATYGVSCEGNADMYPTNRYSIGLNFLAAPDSMETMRKVVFDQIEKMLRTGVTEEEIKMMTSNYLKNIEVNRMHNDYWLNKLSMWDYCGINFDDPKNCTEILENITPADILDFARRFFGKATKVDVTFLPK